MKMPTYVAVTICTLSMLAAGIVVAASVDGALAMAKSTGKTGSAQPIGKPLPPMDPGHGDGRMAGHHSHDGWYRDHERRHHHRRHHSRDESRELYKRGVVPPILMVR